ncbi:MAG: hypothetical protein BGO49_24615 [Planctomycetales bacterium 71-10]|nr:MAG: hypothetical protein BGO49_24615 [Planctomycetales bacterium 71-10]
MKKHYKLEVSVKILERGKWSFEDREAIAFTVNELIPAGVHPVDYARQRLREEVARHASQTTIKTKEEITSSVEI